MEKTDIKNLSVAKRYAKGLIDLKKDFTPSLALVSKIFQSNGELLSFLANPIISKEDKKQVLHDVFKNSIAPEMVDFLDLLIDNKRIRSLHRIFCCYNEMQNVKNNVKCVEVTSAILLSEIEKEKIIQKLRKKLNSKINAEFKLDKAILGGLVFKINDKVIDLSVLKNFENFKI